MFVCVFAAAGNFVVNRVMHFPTPWLSYAGPAPLPTVDPNRIFPLSVPPQRFTEGGDYDDQELSELEAFLEEPREEVIYGLVIFLRHKPCIAMGTCIAIGTGAPWTTQSQTETSSLGRGWSTEESLQHEHGYQAKGPDSRREPNTRRCRHRRHRHRHYRCQTDLFGGELEI